MRQRYMFHKVLSVTICVLYLSLSLFSISCAYHCAFNDELPPSHQDSATHHSTEHTSHDHQHNSSDNHQDDSDHSKVLFCKFVHKVGSSAITVSQMVIAGVGFSLQEVPFNNAVVHQRIDTV